MELTQAVYLAIYEFADCDAYRFLLLTLMMNLILFYEQESFF
jgi:hypothetical protein